MSRTKSVPQRMCIACRQSMDKNLMLRIVKNSEGEIKLDFSGKAPGRGAYICNKAECILKLNKYKLLNKTFSANVPLEVYKGIEEEFFANK